MLFLDGQQAARCVQVTDSRFFDELDKSQAASIGDGRFDRIHFDEAVIHFHAAQGGQQMFYCEDLGFPVSNVVARIVLVTFVRWACTDGLPGKSVRIKTMPVSAGAGRNTI